MSDYSDDEDNEQSRYTIIFEDEPEQTYNSISRDGTATATFFNGDVYVGEYRDGKRNGKGCYTYKNGNKYEGQYVDNEKHGYGVMTFSDKSKYDGEWQRNKRHGSGMYIYANNDSYVGEWQDNMKHGKGRYIYADTGSVYTGEWSNNNLMHGTWKMHDQTNYIGRFSNNMPQGDGLFMFKNGNVQNGKFVGGKWIKDNFKIPGVDQLPPKPVVPSVKDKATRLINKSLLVVDHFEGITELKSSPVADVPNFRQSEQNPVFASGQPTLSGITDVITYINEQGFDTVIWVCQRDTPVVFVNNISLTPRAPKDFNTPLVFPELDLKQLPELDKVLQAKVRKELQITGGLLQYMKEAKADVQEDAKRVKLVMSVSKIDEDEDEDEDEQQKPEQDKYIVETMKEIFDRFVEEGEFDVRFNRIVLSDHQIPTPEQVDLLHATLQDMTESTGVLFQSHTGVGQATIGSIYATLQKRFLFPEEEEEAEDEMEQEEAELEFLDDEEEDEDEDDEARQLRREKKMEEIRLKKEAELAANFVPDYLRGEYECIMQLISNMENGEKIKNEVDKAIDQCGVPENIRELIFGLKDKYATAPTTTTQAGFVALAQDYLELYFHFMMFVYYLRTNDDEFTTKYSTWMTQPKAQSFLAILGRDEGALASFNWK